MKRHTIYSYCIILLSFCPSYGMAAAVTSVTDPTTNWTVVPRISLDVGGDQQTGLADSDLVGIVADPGFYTGWDGNNIYYRARLGKTSVGGAFKGVFWIGIDGNNDGTLDLVIGVNNQGSTAQIGFYAPGTGANNSPNTTSIATGLAQYQTNESATNFNYQTVNSTIEPTLVNSDINNDGTDVFLSIMFPFFGSSGTATLQGAMAGLGGISIDANSRLGYVIFTSTQTNSINQDIGGLNGGTNSTQTFTQLGAISPQITASGTVVPEPGTTIYFVIAVGLVLPALKRRLRPRDSGIGSGLGADETNVRVAGLRTFRIESH